MQDAIPKHASESVIPTYHAPSKKSKAQDITKLLNKLENMVGNVVSIHTIGRGTNLQVKRLYEVMNVCCVLGASIKLEGSSYQWLGLSRMHHKLESIFSQTEGEACKKSLVQIFNIGKSSTIEELTLNFIKLFFYLGTTELEIRDAVDLFASHGAKHQTILRRLYCITRLMKTIGIIDHPCHKAHFCLRVDINDLKKKYYQTHSIFSRNDPTSIIYLMNHVDNDFVDRIFVCRQEEFQSFLQNMRTYNFDEEK